MLLTLEEAADHQATVEQRDDLAARVEELEAELYALRQTSSSIDVQALATALVVPLRQEWQRKPGPKAA